MATPNQFLLFPDPRFSGPSIISSITSQGGRTLGQPVPQSGNNGNLLPFHEGSPDADDTLEYQVVQGGGVESATFGWRNQDEDDNLWGTVDFRHLHDPSNPFYGDDAGPYGLDVVYSTAFNRLLIFRRSNVATSANPDIDIRYRDMAPTANPRDWTSVSIDVERWGKSFLSSGLSVVELPDGVLMMVLQFAEAGGVNTDFDVYHSDDGGLTWSCVNKNILRQFGLRRPEIRNPRMAISGDWVRLSYINNDSSQVIETIITSDRGATWTEINTPGPATSTIDNGDAYDNYSFDTIGLDDRAGGFLLVQHHSDDEVTFYYATADQDWQDLGTDFSTEFFGSGGVSHSLKRVVVVRDASRVHVMAWCHADSTIRGSFAHRSCAIDDVLDIDAWSALQGGVLLNNQSGFPIGDASKRYEPSNIHAILAADRIVFVSGLNDTQDSWNVEDYVVTWSMLGWNQRSFALARGNLGIGIAATQLFKIDWMSIFGRPEGGSHDNPNSPWTYTASGTPVLSWFPDFQRIQCVTNEAAYFGYNDGASPSRPWVDADAGVCFLWECQIADSGSGATQAFAGLEIAGLTSGGASGFDIDVRFTASSGTTQVRLYDNVASKLLTTENLPYLHSEPYEFRFAVDHIAAQTVVGELSWRRTTEHTWADSGSFTIQATGTPANQHIRFGMMNLGDSDSYWSYVKVAATTSLLQIDWDEDEYTRGMLCSARAQSIDNGMRVRWGGGGGFRNDLFIAEHLFLRGQSNIFTASPTMQWHSADNSNVNAEDEQITVFDAGAGKRFIHDAMGIFDCQVKQVVVQYHTSDSWGSPSAVETIDMSLYPTAVTVSSLDADTAVLFGTPTTDMQPGELVDHYIRDSAVGVTQYTCKIEKHLDSGYIQTTGNMEDNWSGSEDYKILTPSKVVVFSERHKYRYMRWVVSGGTTHAMYGPGLETRFGIGSVVVGTTLPLDVPINWTWDDDENPNVELNEAPGGVRWSRKEGPPRRAVEGRIEGDVTRFRTKMKGMLSHLSEYSLRPMVLILNDLEMDRPGSIFYSRYMGSFRSENEAWYTTNGVLHPLGHTSFRFEEEI